MKNTKLIQLAKTLTSIGGDPVGTLTLEIANRENEDLVPIQKSCLVCKNQEKCSFKMLLTDVIKSESAISSKTVPDFGNKLYSIYGLKCIEFKKIKGTIFK